MLRKSVERYEIPFRGLKNGEHDFDFLVTDKFFDAYGTSSEVHHGNVLVKVLLTKESRMLSLDFTLSGTVKINCDRCLGLFDQPIDFHDRLIVRFGSSYEELEANVMVVPEEEGVLVLNQYIYEFIHLALPVRRVHPDDATGSSTCNPAMLRKLDDLVSHTKDDQPDPRWSVLKNYKNFN